MNPHTGPEADAQHRSHIPLEAVLDTKLFLCYTHEMLYSSRSLTGIRKPYDGGKRKRLVMRWAVLCLATCLAAISPGQPADPELDKRIAAWEKYLAEALANAKTSIIVDVDTRTTPPPALQGLEGVHERNLVEGLASVTNRELVEGSHGVAFKRAWPTGVRPWDSTTAILEWLTGKGAQYLDRLGGDGMAFSELDSASQKLLLANAGNSGVVSAILRHDFVHVKVRANPHVEYTDTTGARRIAGMFYDNDHPQQRARLDAVYSSYKPPRPSAPKNLPAPVGEIRFSPGKLFTVNELSRELRTKHQVRIQYDARLGESHLFVQGMFSGESIIDVLRAVLTTQEPSLLKSPPDVNKILGDLFSNPALAGLAQHRFGGDMDALDPHLFVRGETANLGDLARMSPWIKGWAQQVGLSLDSSVRLRAGLSVSLWAAGSTILHIDEQGIKHTIRNTGGIGIPPAPGGQ